MTVPTINKFTAAVTVMPNPIPIIAPAPDVPAPNAAPIPK